jgi:DNA-binding transcriptional regulator YiaG
MSTKIKEARERIGMSRAEMSRQFEIPIRTLEDWDSGKNHTSPWVEKLILEKLERIAKSQEY